MPPDFKYDLRSLLKTPGFTLNKKAALESAAR
jgi:hypothetical protein